MTLTPELEGRLRELTRVFLAENENINLSALRTEEKCWNGNVLDSLAILDVPHLMHSVTSMIDVGTGGGFPLFPLAFALPKLRCTGLDSIGKKMEAIKRIMSALHLKNIQTVTGRAEEIGHHKAHREHYDLVTSRAVAPLPMLLEYCSPFVKVGGWVVLWKSLQIEEELKASERAQQKMFCLLESTHKYDLDWLAGHSSVTKEEKAVHLRRGSGGQPTPNVGWGERQLLIFRKTKSLPKEFPRAVGMAKKEPV